MRNLVIILLCAVTAAASPLAETGYSSACAKTCPTTTATFTSTKTKTSTLTTCTTSTIYVGTALVATTTTRTLTPCCPISTVARRDVLAPAYSSSSGSDCSCTHTAFTTVKATATIVSTKTLTETIEAIAMSTSTITIRVTPTPSVFYLSSSHDNGYAMNVQSGDAVTLDFSSPCSGSSALFSLNATTGQLIDHTGIASGWQSYPVNAGAAGAPIGFVSSDSLAALAPPVTCSVGLNNALSCCVNGNCALESCYGELLSGASHLCSATTVTIEYPFYS